MAILLDETTPVIVQGISGRIGSFHAEDMIRNGTNVVGGVTPGKGGQTMFDRPIFNTVKGAVAETGAQGSIIFVPPPFAADAIMEAADAGIGFCVCITDGIPAQDMMRVKRYQRRYKAERRMRLTRSIPPAWRKPPRKPTNWVTRMSGPGVVSARPRPSSISAPESQ